MLVHLSPWQTIRTSIPSSTTSANNRTSSSSSRRRKRSDSSTTNHNDDDDHDMMCDDDVADDGGSSISLPVAVSFVLPTSKTTTRRRLAMSARGRKNHSSSSSKSAGGGEMDSSCVPFLSITSPHKVAVIGRSPSSTVNDSMTSTNTSMEEDNNEGDIDGDGNNEQKPKKHRYHYQELTSHFQYRSRPGTAGSFLPNSNTAAASTKTSSSSQKTLPYIPAMVDPQQDRVYALQQNNTRLCCWRAWDCTGPDDNNDTNNSNNNKNKKTKTTKQSSSSPSSSSTTLKADLQSPAVSLRILPMPRETHQSSSSAGVIVYGTCQDGSVFVGRVITTMRVGGNGQNDDELVIEYLSKVSLKSDDDNDDGESFEHVDTIATVDTTGSSTKEGKKRKMSLNTDGTTTFTVTLYQIYGNHNTDYLTMIRHDVDVDSMSVRRGGVNTSSNNDRVVKLGSLVQRRAILPLLGDSTTISASPPSRLTNVTLSMARTVLKRVQIVVSSVAAAPTVAIVYTLAAKPDRTNAVTLCAELSLATGKMSTAPLVLPSQSSQFSFGLANLFVAASHDTLSFYNLATGSLIQSTSIKALGLSSTDRNWTTMSDATNKSIAIIVAKPDGIQISCSEIQKGEDFDPSSRSEGKRIKSSSLLASSILATSAAQRNIDTTSSYAFPKIMTVDPSFQTIASKLPSEQTDRKVQDALQVLNDVRLQLSGAETTPGMQPMSFLAAFRTCISSLTSSSEHNDNTISERMATGNGASLNVGHDPQVKKKGGIPNGCSGKNGIKISPKTVILPDNDKPANGSHHIQVQQKAHKIRLSIPDILDKSFVDGSLRIALSMLQQDKTPDAVHSDVRSILKSLLNADKVSARLHMEGSYYSLVDTTRKHPLFVTLRSLERTGTNHCGLSPVDMIVLMLRKCSDITERQLVIMVDYMLCRATEEDISAALLKRRKHKTHGFKDRNSDNLIPPADKRSTSTKTGDDAANRTNTGTKSVHKNVMSEGLQIALEMIVSYTECNDSMLRTALREGVSSSNNSAPILVRLLSNVLTESLGTSSSIRRRLTRRYQVVRSVCQWIAAVCDEFSDDLKSSTIPSSGKTYFEFALESIKRSVKSSEALISCNDHLWLAENRSKKKRKVDHNSSNSTSGSSNSNSKTSSGHHHHHQDRFHDDDFPGYSIDRLVF